MRCPSTLYVSDVVAEDVDVHLDGRTLLLHCGSCRQETGSRSHSRIPAGIPPTLIDFRENINVSGGKTHSHHTKVRKGPKKIQRQ